MVEEEDGDACIHYKYCCEYTIEGIGINRRTRVHFVYCIVLKPSLWRLKCTLIYNFTWDVTVEITGQTCIILFRPYVACLVNHSYLFRNWSWTGCYNVTLTIISLMFNRWKNVFLWIPRLLFWSQFFA